MVDNFEQIKRLMIFPKADSFYFMQILQRKKDHPGTRIGGSNNNSRLIRAYYLSSIEKLDIYKEEIVKMCDLFNARASINLNPRSYEKAAFDLLIKVADQMKNRAFYAIPSAYNTICGEYHNELDKRWIVDIDKEDMPKLEAIQTKIDELQATDKTTSEKREILAVIPSKSGCHIVTNPFRLDLFREAFPTVETHRNNPTNLYIP